MFNDVLTLIHTEITRDKIGNQIKNETERDVLCNTRSATRYEFYNYGVADRVPEVIVIMNKCEYFGETDCIFRGRRYFIRRTYEPEDERDLIELTLEKGQNQNG